MIKQYQPNGAINWNLKIMLTTNIASYFLSEALGATVFFIGLSIFLTDSLVNFVFLKFQLSPSHNIFGPEKLILPCCKNHFWLSV